MHHFVLIMLTFMGGHPMNVPQPGATFDDFATCNRVAQSLRHADSETGIVTSPYCIGRP